MVTVASIHIPLLHELYYDEGSEEVVVVGGGGFFIEPLNYLSNKLNFTLKLKASGAANWQFSGIANFGYISI